MDKNRLKIVITFFLIFSLLNIFKDNSTEAATKSFTDVPTSHVNYKAITNLVERGVINGFSDGTFKPTKQVTRAEFAAFVARALNLPTATSKFKDVPKSAELYDGVSKAYKAGTIKGFSDGTFKPNVAVNRQEMAVMIDRAMQLKGSYTKTKTLDFSDTSKVGAYAKTSVQRMYYYNVMTAYSGKNFAGTNIGTRAETAKVIYNMLTVIEGGTVTAPKPPVTNKSYKDMTLAELKQAYPQHNHVIVQREWKTEAKIVVEDMMEEYYLDLRKRFAEDGKDAFHRTPDEWFALKLPGYIKSYAGNYIDYPMREVIAYNGKSYKDSTFMDSDFAYLNSSIYNQMPSQPTQTGKFLIDIHRYDNDFVAYRNTDVKWDTLAQNPVVVGDDYFVDLYGALQYGTGITMAKGGLEIAYDGQKIILTNGSKSAIVNGKTVTLSKAIEVKNGRAYGLVSEIVEKIGLYTKAIPKFKRIEITNFLR
ncbi:S-layer homology domain-containing protein [Psychrobacillus sp. OK028]|uniref:S-layer homology domain-containing protein n=1 Tax=Psychrobacillus sp. OK028 TaxID=1884359 RepID=UPI000890FD92|nr:S-layer homology domain-containing protein [Psychrobacillus sp. OK028]SDM35063.1 S-layer homology domain-containing protein [Psychrobacillus sp. OK028]